MKFYKVNRAQKRNTIAMPKDCCDYYERYVNPSDGIVMFVPVESTRILQDMGDETNE